MTSKHNGQAKEESLIEFPTDFTIKIMGKNNEAFENSVLEIITKHFPDFKSSDTSRINKRFSKDNNYLSLSVTVYAMSKAQLDAAYEALSGCDDILVSL